MRAPAFALVVLLGCHGAGGSASPDAAVAAPDGAGTPDAAAATTGRVTLTDLTPQGGMPLQWVAFSDGDGPWQAVEGTGGVYSFTVQSGRYGLAFVCLIPPFVSGEVVQATTAELSALAVDCGSADPASPRHISGQLTGVPAGATVTFQAGSGHDNWELQPVGSPATTYEVDLPPATYDLAAISWVDARPTHLVLHRDLALVEDTVLNLDFAQGLPLAQTPLAVVGDPTTAPRLTASVTLVTPRARVIWSDYKTEPNSYPAPPASALGPDDHLELEVDSSSGGGPSGAVTRGVVLAMRLPRAVEVMLPPALSAELSIPAGGPPRPAVSFKPYPGALYYQLAITQVAGSRAAQWLCIFSAAWLRGGSSYQLPDFSSAPRYRAADFGLEPLQPVDVAADAVTSSRDLSRTLNDDPASRDGSRLTYARKGETLTPR